MRTFGIALAAALAVVVTADAQSRPDFSGTWQLDRERSDAAAHSDVPGPVRVTIRQTDAEMHVETTTSKGTTTVTYRMAGPEPLSTGTPLARWRGEALVTEAVRDVRGQSVTVQQTRQLSSDGKEMVVESVVNVQHGYTLTGAQTYSASRDVFVRVQH